MDTDANTVSAWLTGFSTYGGREGAPAGTLTYPIAFMSDRDGNREIYVMDGDGSNPTNLTDALSGEQEPTWSPHGSWIAFYSLRDGNREIYVMVGDGSYLMMAQEIVTALQENYKLNIIVVNNHSANMPINPFLVFFNQQVKSQVLRFLVQANG